MGMLASLERSGSACRSWLRILVALAIAAPLPVAAEPPGSIASLAGRILRVHAYEPDGRTSLGSGVPIAADLVVTNCHVTRRATMIRLVPPSGDRSGIVVESQAGDPEHDLCVLKTAGRLPVTPVAQGAAPRRGDPVIGVGYTGGLALRMHPGEVVASFAHDGARVLQTTTAFNLGASGGGLFDADHRLIGIMTFRDRNGAAQYFSMPVDWVRSLAATGPFLPVAPLDQQTAFWERAPDEQPPFLRARALEATQRWPEFETAARDWSNVEPDNPAAWYTLGRALQRNGRLGGAIDAFERCVQLDGDYGAGWLQLGLTRLRSGRPDLAGSAHTRLAVLDPTLAQELEQRMAERASDDDAILNRPLLARQ